MSVDFLLQSKYKYKQIEYHINEILHLYNEFIELVENDDSVNPECKIVIINKLENDEYKYQSTKEELQVLTVFSENELKTICNHNYVKDLIDITPDLSREIEYCTLCEHTK